MPGVALIAGAGVGGLAAALVLKRAGWKVRVFERSARLQELGFGLMLAPNAMAALQEIGLADRVRERGFVPRSVEIRSTDGRLLRQFRTDGSSTTDALLPVIALRRALYGTLLDALGQDSISVSSEVTGFAASPDGVTLHLAAAPSVTGDFLIGADGVRSVVRHGLQPGGTAPTPSVFAGIRGVAFDAARLLPGLDALAVLGAGLEAAAVRASPDAIYWYASLIGSEYEPAPSAERVREALIAKVDARLRDVANATRAEELRFERFLEMRPLPAWGRGRVTLLGDAAHPVLPHTGQGAAQALEDAVAIGLALAATPDIETALRKYERVRAKRTRAIVNSGPRIARVTTTRSAGVNRIRDFAIRAIPTSLMAAAIRMQSRDPHRALRT